MIPAVSLLHNGVRFVRAAARFILFLTNRRGVVRTMIDVGNVYWLFAKRSLLFWPFSVSCFRREL